MVYNLSTHIKKQSALRILFGIVVSLSCIILLLTSRVTSVYAQSDNFIRISGRDLVYHGQVIYLRGSNQHNYPWNNSWKGNVADVQLIEADYAKMAEIGGNHFRFGITHGMWEYQNAAFYQMMDQQIDWARKYGIWLIPVIFGGPGGCESSGWGDACNMQSSSQQNRLIDFWKDFANHYKNEPIIAGYDVLNEPAVSSWWWTFAQRARDEIYSVDQNHLVFLTAGSDAYFPIVWNGNNIVYQVHDYVPTSMTHCSSSVAYPGNAPDWDGQVFYWDRAAFSKTDGSRTDLRSRLSINWANSHNVPIYIGEWGTNWCTTGTGGQPGYLLDHAQLFREWNVSNAHLAWKHGQQYWGLFPDGSSFVPYNQASLDALKIGFTPSVRANGGGGGGPSPTPGVSPQPSPTLQPSASTPQVIPGDVNGDGVVNVGDVLQTLNHYTTNPVQVTGYRDQIVDSKINTLDFGRTVAFLGIVQPSASPTGNYPHELNRSAGDSRIHLIEIQAPQGNKVFIKAEVDSSVSVVNVVWYINGSWTTQDNTSPYFLGGDSSGTPNGFTFSSTGNQTVRAVVYYNTNQNYIEATTVYSL